MIPWSNSVKSCHVLWLPQPHSCFAHYITRHTAESISTSGERQNFPVYWCFLVYKQKCQTWFPFIKCSWGWKIKKPFLDKRIFDIWSDMRKLINWLKGWKLEQHIPGKKHLSRKINLCGNNQDVSLTHSSAAALKDCILCPF